MVRTDEHVGKWLDIAGKLLSEPIAELPCQQLTEELIDTLEAAAGVWVEHKRGRVPRVVFRPPAVTPATVAINTMQPHVFDHPLVRWFSVSSDLAAQTISRVPPMLGGEQAKSWRRMTAPLGLEEQLSIPIAMNADMYRAFVVMRPERDFSDHQLKLARRIQPLLVGLDRQARVLAAHKPVGTTNVEIGLTGRELAVLGLVADGLTASAAARRLTVSSRTVEKHLEHAYVKLRCSDRVTAVLKAQTLGLLPGPSVREISD